MHDLKRREFLKLLASVGVSLSVDGTASAFAQTATTHSPAARIMNEYVAFLPGEEAALAAVPKVSKLDAKTAVLTAGGKDATAAIGDVVEGWKLVAIPTIDGKLTAVFEKRVTYRSVLAFVTEAGTIASVPSWIGDLGTICPRKISAPENVQLKRESRRTLGPDVPGNYILNSSDDPCYENVSALGAEYIGWTFVGNEQAGPHRSLYLQADGVSRELNNKEQQAAWAPDEYGAVFDPASYYPNYNPQNWQYEKGYSKRTLLGGYLPIADIGVWNPEYKCGYQVTVLLPDGLEASPISRVRMLVPEDSVTQRMRVQRDEQKRAYTERYVGGDANAFFTQVYTIWKHWHTFFESSMPVEVPDEWTLAAARAGIVLSRCSYRGLEPSYQIGEGAYTVVPERSHALFPVASYEFVWAHQIWNLTGAAEPYFQHYLDKYVLPDGNFIRNTQDQIEAPFDVGMFLVNSARAYFYDRDIDAFHQRLPILRRMIGYILARYEYTKNRYPETDPHHGLIWGSPEADLGRPGHDGPDDHPYFYENSTGNWRGLNDHAVALRLAAKADPSLGSEGDKVAAIAAEMRANIERSLKITISRMNPEMQAAGITPFHPDDIDRKVTHLVSYENHRFMQDWFLADWGDPALDLGHLKHRELAGMQLIGLHMDDNDMRTSNFMEHGTLAVHIRQDDYKPFLLTMYGLLCFTMDSGNRYSPEDAMIPGGYAGEGFRYWWASTVTSTLQPTMALRWLLCYEESDHAVCHLQKAAPKHWFEAGKHIAVSKCPTRFSHITWRTSSLPGNKYEVEISWDREFTGDLHVHIHPANGAPIRSASAGRVQKDAVVLDRKFLQGKQKIKLAIA